MTRDESYSAAARHTTCRSATAALVATLLSATCCVLAGASAPAAAATACTPTSSEPTVTLASTSVALGGTLGITGTGWCHPTDGGSVIGVKLDDGAYSRLDGSVHGNRTIWATIEADAATGAFSTSITVPDGTTATSSPALSTGTHTLRLLSGSLRAGDTTRSVQSVPFAVGTATPPDPTTTTPPATGGPCTPTTSSAQVEVSTGAVALGGTLRITGSGWCHPTSGGSRIGIKLDDGAYSHLDGSVSSNRTVWAVVDADPGNGTFTADLPLPDGTSATSSPAFPAGEHTLRLLSGTLVAGDRIRSVQSTPFLVGSYRPNGTPDPVDAARLDRQDKHGTRARHVGNELVLTVPRSSAGTFVFLTLYAPDGSPRYPWKKWARLGEGGKLTLPWRTAGLRGTARLVVQSGDAGRTGDVLGWTRVALGQGEVAADTPITAPTTTPTTPSTTPPVTPTPPTTSAAVDDLLSAVPGTDPVEAASPPALPVASYSDLDPGAHGSVSGRFDGGLLTLTARRAAAGDRVFLTAYTAGTTTPVGWAELDADLTVRLDLAAVAAPYAAVTVQDARGELLGWTPVALGSEPGEQTSAPSPATQVQAPTEAVPVPEVVVATQPGATTGTWLTTTDGLLLATGALLVLAAAVVAGGRRPSAAAS